MFRPSLSFNVNGKIFLSVAQCCIFDYELPQINSFNFNRCNGFIAYRSILQKKLYNSMSTEEISRIASETWRIAEDDFRSFFSNYADEINKVVKKNSSIKFKQFKMKPTKRKCKINSQKSNRSYLYIEQEEVIREVYEKEVEEFKFASF
jgi:hypothetical protein